MLSVDVIIPCRNEVSYIDQMLTAVLSQDYPKNLIKIYVVDGMSNDGTRDVLKEFAERFSNIYILDNPDRTTPKALNIGIKASFSEVVVRMDCHANYPKNYIAYLVENLATLNADNVGVCVETLPAKATPKCIGIALALSSKIGVGGSQFRVGVNDVRAVDTVPFGCYRRDVFTRIGYFDEGLTRNQDDEFNSRLIKNGGQIFILPKLRIEYFARDTYAKLAKMYFQYGLFKPLSNLKSGRVVSIRQLVPSSFLLVLVFFAFGGVMSPLCIRGFLGLLLIYELTVFSYSFVVFSKASKDILVPLSGAWAVNILHFSYGYGFIKGLWKVSLGWRGSEVGMSR